MVGDVNVPLPPATRNAVLFKSDTVAFVAALVVDTPSSSSAVALAVLAAKHVAVVAFHWHADATWHSPLARLAHAAPAVGAAVGAADASPPAAAPARTQSSSYAYARPGAMAADLGAVRFPPRVLPLAREGSNVTEASPRV